MSFQRDSNEMKQIDETLEQTLKDFRSSVHAWSDAEFGKPHRPVMVYRTSRRLAAAVALGCVLAVGSVAGGLFERHHVQEQARIAVAVEQQKRLAAEQRKQNEELFAKVDSDVSREVPSAMEPLAQMMALDSTE